MTKLEKKLIEFGSHKQVLKNQMKTRKSKFKIWKIWKLSWKI